MSVQSLIPVFHYTLCWAVGMSKSPVPCLIRVIVVQLSLPVIVNRSDSRMWLIS